MRITITSGPKSLLTVNVEPGGAIEIQSSRLLRSAELRRALVLALAVLAEQRQWLTGGATDVAQIDVSSWQALLAPKRRRVPRRRSRQREVVASRVHH